ncbi:MAG: GIY-YIG nuclease family protein [Parcubacteria group bacterium]
MAYVYILGTSSGKYYIGSTSNLERRLKQHFSGQTDSTKRLGKPHLIFHQEYLTLEDARSVEKKLKNLKRKDYLEKIISDGYIKIQP